MDSVSRLIAGKVPQGQLCPFRGRCSTWEAEQCHHKGVKHPCDFSCATARAFDLIERVSQPHSGKLDVIRGGR
jgi:hypothetical protein